MTSEVEAPLILLTGEREQRTKSCALNWDMLTKQTAPELSDPHLPERLELSAAQQPTARSELHEEPQRGASGNQTHAQH